MANEPISHIENDDLSIRELIVGLRAWIHYLWSKWHILLVSGILGGVLGLIYGIIEKPSYIANTTFVLEGGESKGGLGRLAGVAAMVGVDIGGGAGGLFQGDNILELYKSRRMLTQALLTKVDSNSEELLIDRYLTFNGIREGWSDNLELRDLDFHQDPVTLDIGTQRLRDSLITSFVNNIRGDLLNVQKPDKDLSIIQVSVVSPDEVFSKVFNENLVKGVNDFYVQTRTKKSRDNIVILQSKVDSVRSMMSQELYSAARASDVTPNINPTRQVQRVVPVQEAQFSAEANRTILSQLIQNLELAKMAELQEQPLIQLVDQPVYPLPVNQLGKRKGLIIGGILFGFVTLFGLIGLKWYRDIMTEENR